MVVRFAGPNGYWIRRTLLSVIGLQVKIDISSGDRLRCLRDRRKSSVKRNSISQIKFENVNAWPCSRYSGNTSVFTPWSYESMHY